MTILQLRYVYEVEKCGSIHKAAAKLYVSQPNISQQIAALEKELDITIFSRTPSGVVLTADGQKLMRYINVVLFNLDYIEEHFKDVKDYPSFSASSQHFSVVSEAYCLLQERLSDKEAYALSLSYEKTDEIFESVQTQQSEIGILVRDDRSAAAFERLAASKNLAFCPLFRDRMCVFLSKTHPLAGRKMIEPEELNAYPCAVYSQTHAAPHYFSEELVIPEVHPQKLLYVNDLHLSVQCMKNCFAFDLGTGFLSTELREDITVIPLHHEATFTFGYLKLKNTGLSGPADMFIELIKECLERSVQETGRRGEKLF